MSRKIICVALVALLLTFSVPTEAQQPKKVPRIAYVTAASFSAMEYRIEAFRQGLRELGYVEGKNIIIQLREAEGKLDRLPTLMAELVREKVDIIVAAGPAKEATNTIPVVMAQVNDPIGAGFVANLARPGGNITGMSVMAPELSGKQLEVLKEVVPRLSRVAVLGTSTQPGNAETLKETEVAARGLKIQLRYFDIGSTKDLEAAFQAASKEHADALLPLSSPVLFVNRTQIVELATKNRLPAIYYATEYVEDGGLMTYAPNVLELWRRAASHVDKILKGAKPADLPVEQPTKFEFIINLKAAKQIGL